MWFLPTYGRPRRCQETLDSIIAVGVSTPGAVIVDGDPDPAYLDLRLPFGWWTVFEPCNRGLSAALNDAAFRHWPGRDWYGTLCDDFIVRTPGWDERLVGAAGASGLAHSNDRWQSETRLAGAVAYGGELVRTLGWLALRCTWHAFTDDALEAVGRACGNWHYCPDVIVEHLHAETGKGPADATYRHSYSRLDADRAAYAAFARDELPGTIERVRRLLTTTVH